MATKFTWEIIHECDLDDGTPTEWCAKLPPYGYVWIDALREGYEVVISRGVGVNGANINNVYTSCAVCKTLTSAKRWAARYL